MIRFLTDEQFNIAIYAGVKRRLPDLDIVRVQDVGLRTAADLRILQFAALEERIVLSHDVHTMEIFALERLTNGKPGNNSDRRMQQGQRMEWCDPISAAVSEW